MVTQQMKELCAVSVAMTIVSHAFQTELYVSDKYSHVTCLFDDNYKCGYRVEGVEHLEWLREKGDYSSVGLNNLPDEGCVKIHNSNFD